MANTDFTPGSGGKIAADTVTYNAESAQLVLGRLVLGAAGAAPELLTKGQQTAANGLPVTLASDQVAAAALANAMSNPTTLLVGSFAMVFNSTTWDRVQTGQADSVGSGQRVPVTPFVFNGSTYDRLRGDTVGLWAQLRAGTTGGLTPYKLLSAASTNATSLKASAGQLNYLHVTNRHASAIAYLKFYNKASAPTVGTDTPVQVYPIPPSYGGFNIALAPGLDFSTGIAFAITLGVADSDTAAVAANDVVVNLGYK